MLGRDTEWRQGNLLTDEGAQALGLVEACNSGKRAVVISHDCDLPNDTELFVEVILGSLVEDSNPMFANARNPRRLHLCYVSDAGESLHLDLRHADRQPVCKAEFAKYGARETVYALPADDKRALKQWLAARYGRPAFPNAFEGRLRKMVGKRSVEQRIAKILEPVSKQLVALFFDLGAERSVEMPDGEAYFLSIAVVYDATEGGQVARQSADIVAQELRELFEQAYGPPAEATEIALEACASVADTFMTLADLRKVDQWRLEYISLCDEPVSDFLPAGAVSV
ncbi:MAG: hypothetical protein DWQ11_12220 [Proteobacteria bacterium]|nr:MAG: hypothetical protein DWQ11_12220 [Pseudomonadota bacterium]